MLWIIQGRLNWEIEDKAVDIGSVAGSKFSILEPIQIVAQPQVVEICLLVTIDNLNDQIVQEGLRLLLQWFLIL